MTKELIIIALIIVIIYLYYQQNQPNINDNNLQIGQLQQEVKHYQNLYENRIKKEIDDSEKVKQLTKEKEQIDQAHLLRIAELQQIATNWKQNYQQLNQRFQTQTEQLKTKQEQEKESWEQEKQTLITQQEQKIKELTQQKEKTLSLTQQELKTSQANNEELEKLLENKEQTSQEQLRKINLLFDANANNYEIIDFNGLYALLASVAEREREREREQK